ncbi:MAG: metallophosphoesterase family protein [Desulfatitalea sp.]
MLIGVLSDTHGLLGAEVLELFKGVDHIIHAGDIGTPQVLSALESLAPVTAVRGNTDNDAWSESLPVREMVMLGGVCFYILHDLQRLDLEPLAAGVRAVISGHTHQPETKHSRGVLYFNPGSASHRRQGGPLSVGRVRISGKGLHSEILHLNV